VPQTSRHPFFGSAPNEEPELRERRGMAALELWTLCKATGNRPSQLFSLPMASSPERMRALAFDLTVQRAARKARGVVLDQALSQAQSAEGAMIALLRMGMEL
jgi:hypothetical protein